MYMADSQYQPSNTTASRGTKAFVLDLDCWNMLQTISVLVSRATKRQG
jgi:hypothetical protein